MSRLRYEMTIYSGDYRSSKTIPTVANVTAIAKPVLKKKGEAKA